jgi:hypothetical protein
MDAVLVEHPIALAVALPRVFGAHAIDHLPLICSWDPSGVFRPPRVRA